MYLGSLITGDGRSEKEIKTRIMIARATEHIHQHENTTIVSRHKPEDHILRAIKCYIWPTLFYGAETWSIIKILLSRLDAFEMLVYRSKLKISMTEKITNEEAVASRRSRGP